MAKKESTHASEPIEHFKKYYGELLRGHLAEDSVDAEQEELDKRLGSLREQGVPLDIYDGLIKRTKENLDQKTQFVDARKGQTKAVLENSSSRANLEGILTSVFNREMLFREMTARDPSQAMAANASYKDFVEAQAAYKKLESEGAGDYVNGLLSGLEGIVRTRELSEDGSFGKRLRELVADGVYANVEEAAEELKATLGVIVTRKVEEEKRKILQTPNLVDGYKAELEKKMRSSLEGEKLIKYAADLAESYKAEDKVEFFLNLSGYRSKKSEE